MMRVHSFFTIITTALCLTACDGAFDGIYDEAVNDDQQQNGFDGNDSNSRYTLKLDARDYGKWYYINLHTKSIESRDIPTALTGEWDGKSQWTYYSVHGSNYTELDSRKVDTQQEPEEWDIAIHHFDAKTNGGEVLETRYSSIDELPASSTAFEGETFTADEWMTNQCITDFSGMMAYNIWYTSSMVNRVLTQWVTMDFTTPPPVYSASKMVYVLRMKDGTCAALRLVDYMSDRGTKGYLTIDVKYPY